MQRATDPGWPFGQFAQLPRPKPRATTRWLWAVPLIVGILTVLGWVLTHDTEPGILALSRRSWITIAAAAIVAILLGAHRRRGGAKLAARVALEYAAVALVVALVTTAPAAATGAQSPAKTKTHQTRAETIAGACPSISRPVAWASCVWTQASKATSHTQQPAKKGKHS
jgi:4-amino-4-deoxy-L-arabinose transferase-like glycosyltransferase